MSRPTGVLPDGGIVLPPVLVAPLYFSALTRPDRDVYWLVEATGDAVAELPDKVMMMGTLPTGGGPDGGYVSGIEIRLTPNTFRWANKALWTAATDSPANTYIEPRVRPVRIETTIGTRPDGSWANRAVRQVGTVTLLDTEGELGGLQDEFVFEGRRVAIKVAAGTQAVTGEAVTPALAAFTTVFIGQIDRLSAGQGKIEIRIRDAAALLDRPMARDSYQGSGGSSGGEELAGVSKPEALGRCRNVPAVLIDTAKQIYQVHSRRMREVVAVYERGLVQSAGPTVASYEALAGLKVEGDEVGETGPELLLGQYATCLASGHIRLGAIPLGIVTADIRGDGDTTARNWANGRTFKGGRTWRGSATKGYVGTAGSLIIRVLEDFANVPEAEISRAQMQQVDRETGVEAGIFIAAGDRATKARDVIERLAASIGSFLDRDSAGRYVLTRLRSPDNFEPVLEINDSMTRKSDGGTTLERLELAYGRPWPLVRMSYARNWRPMSEQEVAEGAARAQRAFALRKWETAEATAGLVNVLHGERAPLEVEGVGISGFAARAQALELTDLYRLGRQQFRGTVKGVGFRLRLGDTVALRHPRHGLQPRRALRFSGAGDNVIVLPPSAAFLPLSSSPHTIAAWVKPGILSAGRFFCIRSSTTGTSVFTTINASGNFQFFSASVTTTVAAAEPLAVGVWAHLVLTYNGTSFTAYINGAVKAGPVVLAPAAGSATVPATVGAFNEIADSPFAGTLDDVRFYTRALALDEVRQLYSYGSFGKHRERAGVVSVPALSGLKMLLDLGRVHETRRYVADLSENGMAGFLGPEWTDVLYDEEPAKRFAVMGIIEDGQDEATTLLLWG